MKLTNLSPIKAGCLVAAAVMLNVAAWAANIDYPGFLKVENFDGIPPGNNAVTGLTTFSKYTNNQPDSITFVPTVHWQRNPSLDDYGSRVSGFLIPTETADYVFFIAADDASSLYLSTDATPANLKLLCADQGWQATRTWTGVGGSSSDGGTTNVVFRRGHNPGPEVLESNGFQWVGPFENRSDEFLNSPRTNLLTGNAWPTKDGNGNAVINLVADQRYYIEILFKEGGGGDYTSVAWKKAGDPDPENNIVGTEIPGSVLLVNWTNNASFITQPVSKQVYDGEAVTFTASVLGVPGDNNTDPNFFTYQWYLDDTEITDGSGYAATYNIPVTTLADNGKKFKVKVTTAGTSPAGVLTLTSTNATLTVINDVLPPKITRFRSSDTFNSAKIIFSEAVRNEALTPGNYVFSGGLTVTSASFDLVVDAGVEDPQNPVNPSNRVAVILITSQQTEGAKYTYAVNNVKDIKGNNLTPNTGTLYANVFRSGVLSYKRWNVGKTGKSTVETDPIVYANPALDETVLLCERNSPSAPEPGYVGLISGFFVPPVTTNYVFFTSQDADNTAVIYLSTDATTVNRKLICNDPGWQNARQWTGAGGDTTKRRGSIDGAGNPPFENRSDQLLTSERALTGAGALAGLLPADGTDPDPWPVTNANGNAFITLTAGVRYSFQQWQPERDGGQMSATYKYAGPENAITEPEPVNGTASRLTGNVIGAFIDPTSVPPTLSIARNGGVTTLTYLGTLLSSSTANGTYLPVAGATSPYTVPTPTVGNQFYRAAFLYP